MDSLEIEINDNAIKEVVDGSSNCRKRAEWDGGIGSFGKNHGLRVEEGSFLFQL